MAEMNFGNTPSNEEQTNIFGQEATGSYSGGMGATPSQDASASETIYSAEELNDANRIRVTIADQRTPLVIFFGPPSCGKTMTLIRLTRYLQRCGYAIEPVTSFRPAHDTNYKAMCENFDAMVGSEDAANSTSKINFMLVTVFKDGKPICQILEGPGEYYFNPEDPKSAFPKYIHAIINSENRKIWAIMVEPDKTSARMTVEARSNYVAKIRSLKSRIPRRDKFVFVFNKIDETPYVRGRGEIRTSEVIRHTDNLYPGIFAPFMNENPLTKWLSPYNFEFVPFQTGDFCKTADGGFTFEQGPDVYPKNLWNVILNGIRG